MKLVCGHQRRVSWRFRSAFRAAIAAGLVRTVTGRSWRRWATDESKADFDRRADLAADLGACTSAQNNFPGTGVVLFKYPRPARPGEACVHA